MNKPDSITTILDTSINVLKSYGPFADKISNKHKITNIDKKLIARGWIQLEKDGFAYSKVNGNSTRYFISFDGLLALENCPMIYAGRPYKWKAIKVRLNTIWRVISIVAIIFNALVILLFTYWTYIDS